MKHISCLFAALIGLAFTEAPQARAQNLEPPSGPILDLAGQPLPSVYTQYMIDFTASIAATDITFAFRNDPSFTMMDDVSVTDLTAPAGNLITNGNFATGDLTGWRYDDIYGGDSGTTTGFVVGSFGSCGGGDPNSGDTYDYCDGATNGYDAIDQLIATTIGDVYQVSFRLNLAPLQSLTNPYPASGDFQALSNTAAPNGVDLLVYAQATLPPAATPEPVSAALVGTGLAALVCCAFFRRYRETKA